MYQNTQKYQPINAKIFVLLNGQSVYQQTLRKAIIFKFLSCILLQTTSLKFPKKTQNLTQILSKG
ncbi:hypothetical protein CSQ79_03750 [Gloeocapsopsis sp. IPPAS B-1203]|nr:hypothetical protein CSQ79_03750 [Gloeocapsopsis sp. IPPAS B-1203]